jgi:hypothetical protein
MFADMLARRGLSNRDLAAELGCSEGTVRNTLLYARAADLCTCREDCPDEDAIANMTIQQVRDLIAELEGIANEAEAKPKPGDAPEEARILARLKRA